MPRIDRAALKKAIKRYYDILYRKKNRARLKREKAEYFQRTYDPVKAAKERKKKMPKHVEYCRQPWYRKYKQGYDQKYLSQKRYGLFWESAILIRKIQKIVCQRVPDIYERMKMRGHIQRGMLKAAMKRQELYGWAVHE